MEEGYRTMDPEYTESIWWAFKTLYGKNLIYEGYKSMHICPRCETTLAVSEVAMGYKDINDLSVTVKFELADTPGTYLLAWTTTPWTLPGNAALAINPEVVYSKFQISSKDGEHYIIAKDRLSTIEDEYKIIDEFKGSELVGKQYRPLFNYYKNTPVLKNKENGWKIYPAEFVNTEEGTGIVHIAPAFGEEDMRLGKEYNLPFIQHVSFDGIFKPEVSDFNGLAVKPRHDHQATDIKIITHLVQHKLLFKKEKITHSYPFCWRCDTPLLNYAASSWFVDVVALKQKLLRANKKIQWIPSSIQYGRFGKWLLNARDWAISRSRFWGAPIPVWKCSSCKKMIVIGSMQDLKDSAHHARNKYFVMRHAEAESNVKGIINSRIDERYGLTKKGEIDARATAKTLKDKKIDFIITSPLPRTLQTARIVAGYLKIADKDVLTDTRLRELEVGVFEGKSLKSYHSYFSSPREQFTKRPEGGENLLDLKKRVGVFFDDIDKQYKDKKILLITHESPVWQLFSVSEGWTVKQTMQAQHGKKDFIRNAEILTLPHSYLPKNADYELDLHKPFIDKIELPCQCGGKMKRIPEVFDCWFESGAMPFAQFYYPFKNKKVFQKNFPAHFIAEGIDQTRGWFYHMLVLSVGLFGKTAYKNVIVNGLILTEDGQKMSKKLKNYPDPVTVINTYGADSLRYYLLSSSLMRGEDLNFSEKDVKEIMNKIITRLYNVYSFYELYNNNLQPTTNPPAPRLRRAGNLQKNSPHILDRWIRIRLSELVNKVTYAMDKYELDKAARPIGDFIDDLSVWYIRRSRDRFRGENKKGVEDALATTRFVLIELAKIMAPFTPFIADELYRKVTVGKDMESVHLSSWPKEEPRIPIWPNPMALFHRLFGTNEDLRVLSDMAQVREIVSFALEARAAAGIKVRQPLSELKIKSPSKRIKASQELTQLIKDEVNVKEIIFGVNIGSAVELNTHITEELRQEGRFRELIRHIQDLRKEKGLVPSQKVVLVVDTSAMGQKFVQEFETKLKKITMLEQLKFDSAEDKKIKIDDMTFIISIKK